MSSPDASYLGQLDPDDPRTSSQQIAAKLRAAILTGKLQPGEKLPSQNELASRYGVARETVKSALRVLDHERLILTRQGSGAYVRARTERQVGLRPHVEAAFERTHVTVDFAGFSGETLNSTLGEVLDKIRAGRLMPESLSIRALIYDTNTPLVVPRRVDASESDPVIQERADRITRRSLGALRDGVNELADLGLIKTATMTVRAHRLAPQFKLFILNSDEAFFAFYPIVEHTATVDGESLQMYDIMGRDATLFHFSANDDETSNGPQYVSQAREWFDSVWNTIATEFQP